MCQPPAYIILNEKFKTEQTICSTDDKTIPSDQLQKRLWLSNFIKIPRYVSQELEQGVRTAVPVQPWRKSTTKRKSGLVKQKQTWTSQRSQWQFFWFIQSISLNNCLEDKRAITLLSLRFHYMYDVVYMYLGSKSSQIYCNSCWLVPKLGASKSMQVAYKGGKNPLIWTITLVTKRSTWVGSWSGAGTSNGTRHCNMRCRSLTGRPNTRVFSSQFCMRILTGNHGVPTLQSWFGSCNLFLFLNVENC